MTSTSLNRGRRARIGAGAAGAGGAKGERARVVKMGARSVTCRPVVTTPAGLLGDQSATGRTRAGATSPAGAPRGTITAVARETRTAAAGRGSGPATRVAPLSRVRSTSAV